MQTPAQTGSPVEAESPAQAVVPRAPVSYTPGAYTRTGKGRNGDVVVSVTFSKDSMTDIQIVEQAETKQMADKALTGILAAILEKQSIAVDAVSGTGA